MLLVSTCSNRYLPKLFLFQYKWLPIVSFPMGPRWFTPIQRIWSVWCPKCVKVTTWVRPITTKTCVLKMVRNYLVHFSLSWTNFTVSQKILVGWKLLSPLLSHVQDGVSRRKLWTWNSFLFCVQQAKFLFLGRLPHDSPFSSIFQDFQRFTILSADSMVEL